MKESDFYWLVGLLEGEGCFKTSSSRCRYNGVSYAYTYPMIALKMTDRDIVDRAAALLGTASIHQRPANEKHRATFECSISGSRAVNLMRQLLPHFGIRRQAKITDLLAAADATREIMTQRKTRSRRERRENPRGFARLSTSSVSAA